MVAHPRFVTRRIAVKRVPATEHVTRGRGVVIDDTGTGVVGDNAIDNEGADAGDSRPAANGYPVASAPPDGASVDLVDAAVRWQAQPNTGHAGDIALDERRASGTAEGGTARATEDASDEPGVVRRRRHVVRGRRGGVAVLHHDTAPVHGQPYG